MGAKTVSDWTHRFTPSISWNCMVASQRQPTNWLRQAQEPQAAQGAAAAGGGGGERMACPSRSPDQSLAAGVAAL